uniref:Integrase_H2C2 domain-containing protein n=1 Tax=Heterorhabditis bacteriophora TaxID=37862 RepID=A0A1I7WAI2_HETBA
MDLRGKISSDEIRRHQRVHLRPAGSHTQSPMGPQWTYTFLLTRQRNAFQHVYTKSPNCEQLPLLMCSKTRLAPLKGTTIPCLELLASLIGCRLSAGLLTDTTYVYTDSRLLWLGSQEVKCLTHVCAKTTPRNTIIRVLFQLHFNKHQSCGHRNTRTHYVSTKKCRILDQDKRDDKKEAPPVDEEKMFSSMNVAVVPTRPEEVIGPNPLRHSSWKRIISTISAMIIFIKTTTKDRIRFQGELLMANKIAIHDMQRRNPQSKDDIINLQLFIDNDGLWRSKGPLENSVLSSDAKDPIYIPRHDSGTWLLIKDTHEGYHHSSTFHTLNELRTRFWIPVKTPFRNVGIDYIEPFSVKVAENLLKKEFSTVLVETEAVGNTRPLVYVSNENFALRPIDFLIPYIHIKHRIDKFWAYFQREYLTSLRERPFRGLH